MNLIPKNAMVYRFSRKSSFDIEALGEQLSCFAHKACGEQDLSKFGWIPPLGREATELFHYSQGWILLCAKLESKILPPKVINQELNKLVEVKEKERDRPLSKAEKNALKDDLMIKLVPQAFTQSSFNYLWINTKSDMLFVDSSGSKKAEDILALLRKTIGSLPVIPVSTAKPIETTMTSWIKTGELPQGFELCDSINLKSLLKGGGEATFKKQEIISDEVSGCLDANKVVTKLELCWQDRFTFTLSDNGSITKIKASDELKDTNEYICFEDKLARYDADICLIEGEFEAFLPALYEALGGLSELSAQTDGDCDELTAKAMSFILESGRCSVSAIQRQFKVGYNRAAAITEELERIGAISSPQSNGTRKILIEDITEVHNG